METQIIKTEDADIIIERKIEDTEIDLRFLKNEKEGCLAEIQANNDTILLLKNTKELPDYLLSIVEKEIKFLENSNANNNYRIEEINKFLE